jgi:hypothetical protein
MSDSATPHKRQSSRSPVEKPPPHRQRLEMSLEFSPDDLDSETHDRLDKEVLKTANYEPSSPVLAAFLLVMIVSVSEGYHQENLLLQNYAKSISI